MKTSLTSVGLVILIGVQLSQAKKLKPEDLFSYTVTMAGQGDSYQAPVYFPGIQGGVGGGDQTLCWLHVSDGQTLYVAYREIPKARLWGNNTCGVFGIGAQLRGRVSENRQYLELFVPDRKGKLNRSLYRITQVGNAATLQ